MIQRVLLNIIVTSMLIVSFAVPDVSAVMNSTNYQIWADSVSTGGNRSTSTNYIVEDTIGDSATGEDASSTNYLLDAGLPAIFAEPVLLMTVSASSLALSPDPITISDVSTGSYTVTVSTNAASGYTLTVVEDGEFRSGGNVLNDVSDGTVSTGVAEYGISVSGTDASFADHRAVSSSALTVASTSSFVSNSVNTITHHAGRTNSQSGGNYSHVLTYSVIGNF